MHLSLISRQLSLLFSSRRRLIIAAAMLHIALALGLFLAGRAQLAPSLIDRDGIMTSFASDSYDYQQEGARLVEVLRQSGVKTWATAHEPIHVKLISIEFALLAPAFGYSTLSAEPFNLFCYLAVVFLVLMLGREVGGLRVGTLAAIAVALWPSFLLHTLQLLKDPLFIAVALALVLCVTTWLTRTYNRLWAVCTCAFIIVTIFLLLLIRFNFGIIIFALALFGFALLVIRQLLERRLLYWNMISPLLILLMIGILLPFYMPHTSEKFKHYPSDQSGQPKSVAGEGKQVPAVISYLPRARFKEEAEMSYTERLYAAADNTALRIGSIRSRFNAVFSKSGSGLDLNVDFRDMRGMLNYLPRACEIGFWAPFPNTWLAAGRHVGNMGRLLSGAETLFIYVCELLALVAVIRSPRELAPWLLLAITTFGVTALGLIVPNIGALYRFRYMFWMLLIILAMKGLESIVTSAASQTGELAGELR